MLPDFVGTLSTVKDALVCLDNSATEYLSRAFAESSSGSCLQEIANRGRIFFKAKSLKALMTNIQRGAREAESKLQHLSTQLCITLKVDQAALLSDQNLRSIIEEHVSPNERFRPAFNAPVLTGTIHLDFESKDADGNFTAPEADLKSSVFISTSPRTVTVARGASRAARAQLPVHGVSVLAEVGKTTALIGLGQEDDIKTHFKDGVLFMKAGATATVDDLTGELCKIMRATCACTSAAELESSKSLADAVAGAARWFHGKQVLFLIDDIWPSSNRPERYLPELEGLLQGSPNSRIAISTRSLQVASKGGSHVDFGERDHCGPISRGIFKAHAVPGVDPGKRRLKAARGILKSCSGLPISLSVAKAGVARRINTGVRFEYACRAYFKRLSAEMALSPGANFWTVQFDRA